MARSKTYSKDLPISLDIQKTFRAGGQIIEIVRGLGDPVIENATVEFVRRITSWARSDRAQGLEILELIANDGITPATDLRSCIDVDHRAISRIIKRLIASGLLEESTEYRPKGDKGGRPSKLYAVTDNGLKVVDKAKIRRGLIFPDDE